MRPPDGGAGGEPPETDMSMRLSRSIVGEAEAEEDASKHKLYIEDDLCVYYPDDTADVR